MPPSFFSKLAQSLQRKENQAPTKPAPATQVSFAIGAIIENRYRLDAELGHGGMGVVYRARDLPNDREVALKIMDAEQVRRGAHEQFLREAQITAQLHHPNIVAVYDSGTINATVPVPFIAMELIRGNDLDQLRGLTYTRIVRIARQICDALAYAHAQGLVHRDLKPGNVLIEKQGARDVAKLVDFGLAIERDATNTPQTSVAGTVYYVAPEVIAGNPGDARADLYALGVMLYEMVTGRVPFSDFDTQAIFEQHLQGKVAPPSHTRPDIPLILESVILRLLAKDPQDRYESADAVNLVLGQVLTALEARATPGNLPRTNINLVGRANEIAQLESLLTLRRCVTLTGAGGIGKTQLALALALRLADHFADGVWLTELGACDDPALVVPLVAATLGVGEESRRPLIVSLTEHLREKNLLLVLDNCGHLAGACRQLIETILRASPDVTLVITSRNPLNLSDETLFAVPPLSPDAALELLRQRTSSPDGNALALIAQQLGIPLALELVAPHINTFATPIAESHDKILNATLEWSEQQLSESAREWLNRLSVFVGGFSETMIHSASVFDELRRAGLLTLVASGEPRYRLLEPIRQFALAKLQATGKESSARQEHRDLFFQLALDATQHLHDDTRATWFARLDAEHLNLLAALDWSIERPQYAHLAFQFGAAMWQFWSARGYWREAQDRLSKILALPYTLSDTSARVRVLISAGQLAVLQNDFASAQKILDEALATARDLNDADSVGFALCGLGALARAQKNYPRSEPLYHDAVNEYQRAGNAWEMGLALFNLGVLQFARGDVAGARASFTHSREKFQHSNDSVHLARTTSYLGALAIADAQYADAEHFFRTSLELWRALGDTFEIANQLTHLGYAELHQAQFSAAHRDFSESVALAMQMNHRQLVADGLYGIAGMFAATKPEFAAQLTGTANALLDVPGLDARTYASERTWVVAQIKLDSAARDAAQNLGRKNRLEKVIAEAVVA